jgi:prepilin-type N-terminal cleavage/methylation domain-containing protein
MVVNQERFDINGFTLIEIWMVIAIIGILSIIEAPNFMSYRQQGYCSVAEEDANSLTDGHSHLFFISNPYDVNLLSPSPNGFHQFFRFWDSENTVINGGTQDHIIIQGTDASGVCPGNRQGWTDHVYTKILR